jgi:hypothetical protein
MGALVEIVMLRLVILLLLVAAVVLVVAQVVSHIIETIHQAVVVE